MHLPAQSASTRGDSIGKRQLGREPERSDGDAQNRQTASSDTNHQTLREDILPVSITQTLQYRANDDEKGSHGEKMTKVACIVDRAHYET